MVMDMDMDMDTDHTTVFLAVVDASLIITTLTVCTHMVGMASTNSFSYKHNFF